ncbi:MAG: ATP-dependent helicase [Clostridia bacterium]|nr:ATP-dependent helicase [Clostridia bacterium]
MNFTLHPYQEQTKQFIMTHPYCGLFLDCGAGKTLTTLSALQDINPHGHILVVAPKNVAKFSWANEIRKWGFQFPTVNLIVNDNGKELSPKAKKLLYEQISDSPPSMYFINREMFPKLLTNSPTYKGKPCWWFPNLVLDELQSFKSYTSNRFKLLKEIRPLCQRVIGLTGTPAPNGLLDLWAQVYAFDQGERLGRNITAYRNTFFRPTMYVQNRPVKFEPLPGAEEEIYRRISDIVISVKTPGLNLPPIIYNNIVVPMGPDEKKLYRTLLREKVLSLSPNNEIVPANAAVLQGKLSQMASGAIYVEEGSHDYIKIHENKLDALDHIVQTTGSPILVAYFYQSDLDMITKRFPDAVAFDGTGRMYDDWNAGNIPLMCIHPKSTGLGLNFQEGGHTLVWYTLSWSLEDYIQTNARLYRQGQQYPVTIHHLLSEHTIDEKILSAVEMKDMTEQRLLDALQYAIQD